MALACGTAAAPSAVFAGGRSSDTRDGAPSRQTLTTTQAVRGLTTAQAAEERPVRLLGQVTYHDPDWGLLFVQDHTGGVYVHRPDPALTLRAGQLVEVRGRTTAGGFAPSIADPVIVARGEGPLPAPATPRYDQLHAGRFDGQLVQLSGVVRRLNFPSDSGHLTVDVMVGGNRVLAHLPNRWTGPAPHHLIDARVRIRAVCGTEVDEHGQFAGITLFVPSLDDVAVEEAATALEALPMRPLSDVPRLGSLGALQRRIKVRGTVTYGRGALLYLRDDASAAAVRLLGEDALEPGDRITVAGFAAVAGQSAVIEDAIVLERHAGAPPSPRTADARRLAAGALDGQLVVLEGHLLAHALTDLDQTLVMSAAGETFTAHLPGAASHAPALQRGSLLRLTGISVAQFDQESARRASSFRLQLRSVSDVAVVEHPSWWTPGRVLAGIGSLSLLVLVVAGWAVTLRSKVRSQTAQIQQRVQQELELQARYRELFDNANDVVCTYDLSGRLTSINRAGERITGYSRYEAGEMSVVDLVAPEHRPRVAEALAATAATGRSGTFEVDLVTRAGARVTMEFDTRPLEAAGGPAGVQAIARDVTARKRTELELQRARDAAEAASRAKSEFVANMSHEVRTPMNGVLGMTELLLETPLTTEQREYVGIVRASADALMHVINDVLDFSKIEAGRVELQPEPFDPRECIGAAVRSLAFTARQKDLRLTLDVDPDVPSIIVTDPGRLRQVLVNLVSNGIKFTAEGEVAVRVSARPPDGDLAERLLVVTVQDTGIGIPADKQAAVFEAFTQADGSISRRFGGTGLGLAISSSLVRLMGGSIQVVSEPGAGSTFTVGVPVEALPALEAPPAATDASPIERPVRTVPPAAARGAGPALEILLVEDNAVNQRVAAQILTRRGHRVRIAGNGREALDLTNGWRPDVVLMDVQMPEMDGFETTAALRAREDKSGTHLPIIAMTAHAMAGDRERCLAAGMDDYVTKPISASALSAAVERLVQRPENTPDPVAGGPIDEAAALARVDGDAELLAEIIDLFLEDAEALAGDVRQAVAGGDAAHVMRVAHRLKGSVATLGATRAADAALALETLGRSGAVDGVEAAWAELEAALREAVPALEALRTRARRAAA